MKTRGRILVVDDDPTVRESCTRALSERGYEVETAASGQEGLERTRCGYYDCALLDLKMPDLDGMEVVRRARESRANMAVLIITGYGTVDTAAEATRLGVSDYVCKPFTPEEIAEAVERAIESAPPARFAPGMDRMVKEIRESAPKPESYEDRAPGAVAKIVATNVGVKKATVSLLNALILGAMAGAYIGFGAALATLVGHDAASKVGVGIAQLLSGAVFSVGLILVVIAGAELFTGNNLMVGGMLSKEYGAGRMLGRWSVVYLANFLGAILLATVMYYSGLWKTASGAVGARALAIANAKINLSFGEAFFRGIGCNWLVCLAVWMALSARDIAGKILAIFFPITAFVALGYEHCVANMYFVPMGMFLKDAIGIGGPEFGALTWSKFLTANLIPVTLGNIVGGGIFVGCAYWWVYSRSALRPQTSARSEAA